MRKKAFQTKLLNVVEAFARRAEEEFKYRLKKWPIDLTRNEIHEVVGALLARQVTLAVQLASSASNWNGQSPRCSFARWPMFTLTLRGCFVIQMIAQRNSSCTALAKQSLNSNIGELTLQQGKQSAAKLNATRFKRTGSIDNGLHFLQM
jgi:hypothetical protein